MVEVFRSLHGSTVSTHVWWREWHFGDYLSMRWHNNGLEDFTPPSRYGVMELVGFSFLWGSGPLDYCVWIILQGITAELKWLCGVAWCWTYSKQWVLRNMKNGFAFPQSKEAILQVDAKAQPPIDTGNQDARIWGRQLLHPGEAGQPSGSLVKNSRADYALPRGTRARRSRDTRGAPTSRSSKVGGPGLHQWETKRSISRTEPVAAASHGQYRH